MTTSVTLLYNVSIEKFVNLESSRWKTRMGFTLYLYVLNVPAIAF